MRDFETRTASGSELFSLIARLHTITFTMLSTISRFWMISLKMRETPLSWHMECSLPVAIRVSKKSVLISSLITLQIRKIKANKQLPIGLAKQVSHMCMCVCFFYTNFFLFFFLAMMTLPYAQLFVTKYVLIDKCCIFR